MDANTIAVIGSWITIFVAILWQSNRHEDSIKALDTKLTGLDTKVAGLDAKVDGLDAKVDGLESRFDKLDGKVDRLGGDVADVRERLARVEGHLMGPGRFTSAGLSAAVPDEPRPEGRSSDPDQLQAG